MPQLAPFASQQATVQGTALLAWASCLKRPQQQAESAGIAKHSGWRCLSNPLCHKQLILGVGNDGSELLSLPPAFAGILSLLTKPAMQPAHLLHQQLQSGQL
jgi:hypothetical protein